MCDEMCRSRPELPSEQTQPESGRSNCVVIDHASPPQLVLERLIATPTGRRVVFPGIVAEAG